MSQHHRRDHSALQLPCGHPNCQRYFKTAAGRTKHRLTAHPTFTPPVMVPPSHESESMPEPDSEPQAEDPQDRRQSNTDSTVPDDMNQFEFPRLSSPPIPNANTEFYGPGNRLYRNYHGHLDGEC